MRFLGDYVNFTGVNFHFLSPWRKCKPTSRGQNSLFASPPHGSQMQMRTDFQSRIRRWQNTILNFLNAQLDFLAILFTPPYIGLVFSILSDSNKT